MNSYPVLGADGRGPVKRRLSDKIEQAFEQACEQGQVEVAACMLKGLDLVLLGQPMPWERRQAALGLLRVCQSRLQSLRDGQDVVHGVQLTRQVEAALF